MNQYDHWLGKLFGRLFGKGKGRPYAVTLGQTTYYSCSYERTSLRWRYHEACHREQWAREGRLKFLICYIYEWIRHGNLNKYEVEARKAEVNIR